MSIITKIEKIENNHLGGTFKLTLSNNTTINETFETLYITYGKRDIKGILESFEKFKIESIIGKQNK